MSIDINVPTLGESVSDATIARWIKKAGDAVAADEPIVELETDKVTLEVPSPVAGKLGEIIAAEGETVEVETDEDLMMKTFESIKNKILYIFNWIFFPVHSMETIPVLGNFASIYFDILIEKQKQSTYINNYIKYQTLQYWNRHLRNK